MATPGPAHVMHKLPFGMERPPWGFAPSKDGHLVATTSAAERWRRAELGEAAIRLLLALGIKEEVLGEMIEVEDPAQLLELLQRRQT
jgi:hypothetical protein